MSEERFILAELNKTVWVFPASLVLEVLVVERDKLLNLPFYSQAILGCIHHKGEIITLVSLREILGEKLEKIKQKLTIIRLSNFEKNLGNIGILIDRILASKNKEELPEEIFLSEESELRLFKPEIFKEEIWQPVRYLLKTSS